MDREKLVELLERFCEIAAAIGEPDARIVINSLAIAMREGCEGELAKACLEFAARKQAFLN